MYQSVSFIHCILSISFCYHCLFLIISVISYLYISYRLLSFRSFTYTCFFLFFHYLFFSSVVMSMFVLYYYLCIYIINRISYVIVSYCCLLFFCHMFIFGSFVSQLYQLYICFNDCFLFSLRIISLRSIYLSLFFLVYQYRFNLVSLLYLCILSFYCL